MPHGESYFSVFFGTFYENVQNLVKALPYSESTWLEHQEVQVHHVLGFLLALLVVLFMASIAGRRARDTKRALIPDGTLTIHNFVEIVVSATYGVMADMMGRKDAKLFLPLIGTCAFLILFSNFMGMIPGFSSPTDNLNTTGACALVVFVVTHVVGIRRQGVVNYVKHFLGPIWWLAPLILIIEVVSHIVRPITLMVRLAANMFADHTVLGVFLGLIPFLVPLPIYLLGTIVMVVQTLVFCMLSTVYIALAIEHEEH